MTLDELREKREQLGSTRRLARIIGRDEGALRDWLDGRGPGQTAAEWLSRVEWRERADGRVALIVRER